MADERHPNCVRIVEDMLAARQIADWLTQKGFPANALMPELAATPGDSLGLTPETITGFEVRVVDVAHAEPARQELDDLRAEIEAIEERRRQRAERTGTVSADCEDCGKSSEWPAAAMGTTETCPHCGAYLDVIDPDENWDDVDYEAAEDEE